MLDWCKSELDGNFNANTNEYIYIYIYISVCVRLFAWVINSRTIDAFLKQYESYSGMAHISKYKTEVQPQDYAKWFPQTM